MWYCRLLSSVGSLRPGLQIAQHREFRIGWRWGLFHGVRKANLPPGLLCDILACDALVDRGYNKFLRLRVGSQQAEVSHDECWSLSVNTQALPVVAPGAVPKRGDEIHPLHERTAALAHHDIGLAAEAGDLRCAASTRQPDLWMLVAANDTGVDVAEAVNLRPTQEANRDATTLQPVLEHLRDRYCRECGLARLWIADRERQHVRLRSDGAGLVDERDVRGVREARQVAGYRGCPDADEAHVLVLQHPRRRDGHHFHCRIVHGFLQILLWLPVRPVLCFGGKHMLPHPVEKCLAVP